MANEMNKLARKLAKAGFTITKKKGGHWKIEHPRLKQAVFAPATPSDGRSIKNVEAKIRRLMLTEYGWPSN